ncbi:MAG: NAD(P)/FAD-dependent oxidoreductase [Myxococcota bacterium]
MHEPNIETDYLIAGAGAVGMAFVDTLLSETNADITIVDLNHKPGGHWNQAYPFVTLHQPSAYYGVSSRALDKGRRDTTGLNRGLHDLATGAEIMAYFDEVMRHTFLPSGRVRYYPMSRYEGDHAFRSLTSGKRTQVHVRKKIVDATFLKTSVPSTHTPNFEVAEGVQFIPLNDLPKMTNTPAGYVIVGGGKTAIDACLWLLEHGADPDTITWIVPNDSWLLDRRNTQPGTDFFEHSMGSQAAQLEAAASATSIEDLFDRLEQAGVLLRIDPAVRPRVFRGATVSQLELEQLRRIRNVVRLGRVKAIRADEIEFAEQTIPTSPGHVHVDCSAKAITKRPPVPVFQDRLITPQTIRSYQPIFSAALIAHVEATFEDEEAKNKLCRVVPLPDQDIDWIRGLIAQFRNQHRWSQTPEVASWLQTNRLDGFARMLSELDPSDRDKMNILARITTNIRPALANLAELAKAA